MFADEPCHNQCFLDAEIVSVSTFVKRVYVDVQTVIKEIWLETMLFCS